MPAQRLLHFALGPRRFALPISEILEIQEITAATAVPGAPAAIAGVVDVRGRIVTLIDLVAIFGLRPDRDSGLLVVQLAEPFVHLGILIAGRVESLETEGAMDVLEADSAPERAPGPVPPGSAPPHYGASGEGPCEERSASAPQGLGREVLLAGARPAFRLDVNALVAYCTDQVRQRFRIAS